MVLIAENCILKAGLECLLDFKPREKGNKPREKGNKAREKGIKYIFCQMMLILVDSVYPLKKPVFGPCEPLNKITQFDNSLCWADLLLIINTKHL